MRDRGGHIRSGRTDWRGVLLCTSVGVMVSVPAVPQVTNDPGITAAQATPPAATPLPPARINTSGKNVDLIVPLRDRVPIGQVTVRIAPDDRIGVSRADLVAALRRGTTPEFVMRIEAIAASDGFVALEALASIDLPMTFDPGALELTMSLDASARPEQTLDFSRRYDAGSIEPDTSARFAAFLSY